MKNNCFFFYLNIEVALQLNVSMTSGFLVYSIFVVPETLVADISK